MNHPIHRRTQALAVLVFLTACSPAPPTPATPVPPSVVDPADGRGTAAVPFHWPVDEGWYRLEVRVDVPSDATTTQRAEAVSHVRWSESVLEITIEATDPDDRTARRQRRHLVVDPSSAARAALLADFERSRTDGLVEVGTGGLGGRRFDGITRSAEGVVVTESWEVGPGPAPWLGGR